MIGGRLGKGERRRLTSQEDDWHLPGRQEGAAALIRTRGGGFGKPNFLRRQQEESIDVDDPPTEDAVAVAEDIEEEEEEEEENATTRNPMKPTHSRVLVKVSQLEQAFVDQPCPECGNSVELKLRTVCIATSIDLVCNNKKCNFVCNFDKCTTTTMHIDEPCKYERMTDYAVNVLFVLGFISVGDGHTEAGQLLGLLGLPNDTTMMNRSFLGRCSSSANP
jgi:hypothetical protein